MTTEREPVHEARLLDDQPSTTPWSLARERLANPAPGQTSWLATVRPDGSPHLMPIIAFWMEDAFHFVVGEGTRKGRNLAADGRCVIATGNTTLPSLDLIVEGHAKPLDDEAAVKRVAEKLGGNSWPLEARGDKVYGPNAPTAGPPPYSIIGWSLRRRSAFPGCSGWRSTIKPSFRSRRATSSTAPESRWCKLAGFAGPSAPASSTVETIIGDPAQLTVHLGGVGHQLAQRRRGKARSRLGSVGTTVAVRP